MNHNAGYAQRRAVPAWVSIAENWVVLITGHTDLGAADKLPFLIADSVQFVSCGELPTGNLQRPGNTVQYLGQPTALGRRKVRRSWLHIHQLLYTQPCSGCGAEIRLRPQVIWHYRLNGLVEIAIKQGVLPVLCAVADLIDIGTGVMISPSLFLYKDVTGERWKELDIAIVHEGELMVGEVKRGKLKVSDIEDFVEIGKTICPHRVVFISFKKPSKLIAGKLNALPEELSVFGVEIAYHKLEGLPSARQGD